MHIDNGRVAGAIPGALWAKSGAGGGNGNCLEVAALASGGVAELALSQTGRRSCSPPRRSRRSSAAPKTRNSIT
ncbi:hypothetical protein [Streptomyces flavotricini]|uniref:hypothetical protein n=1 Tax=Streptomyces flavotricini TaxID=66888 RepID=UPI003557286A